MTVVLPEPEPPSRDHVWRLEWAERLADHGRGTAHGTTYIIAETAMEALDKIYALMSHQPLVDILEDEGPPPPPPDWVAYG